MWVDCILQNREEFDQHLHSIDFFDTFSPQTTAISWSVYLVVGCHSLLCRLGRHRRQPATATFHLAKSENAK